MWWNDGTTDYQYPFDRAFDLDGDGALNYMEKNNRDDYIIQTQHDEERQEDLSLWDCDIGEMYY